MQSSKTMKCPWRPACALAVLACLMLPALTAFGGGVSAKPSLERPALRAMLLGGDVSALARIEEAGGNFRDGGQPTEAIAALVAHGSNAFRIRLFVSPNHEEVQVNDLPYTIALARRVKAAGARLLLAVHYSDTWADPGHQTTPAAWQALDMDALEKQVEDYSADVVGQLKAAGALPDIVQVGNEIDGGLLWPLGRIGSAGSDSPANYARFGLLLKAGVRGVRRALGPRDSVRVMLHFSQGGSADKTKWFFDMVESQGVPYDLIGLSYYPWWHGTLADLKNNLRSTALRFGKDIMVVETEYPWRNGWTPPRASQGAMSWPATPAGQAQFLRDVVDAVAATPSGHGAGVIWWYPEAIRVPNLFVWGDSALALFDDSGNILPAASVFRGE